MPTKPPSVQLKGQVKKSKDVSTEDNPLIKINNTEKFSISFANILNNPESMVHDGFELFAVEPNSVVLDIEKLKDDSEFIVCVRFFEYLCSARFKYDYLRQLVLAGMSGPDVFMMIRHALKTRLVMNMPNCDKILDIEFRYLQYIKY